MSIQAMQSMAVDRGPKRAEAAQQSVLTIQNHLHLVRHRPTL